MVNLTINEGSSGENRCEAHGTQIVIIVGTTYLKLLKIFQR